MKLNPYENSINYRGALIIKSTSTGRNTYYTCTVENTHYSAPHWGLGSRWNTLKQAQNEVDKNLEREQTEYMRVQRYDASETRALIRGDYNRAQLIKGRPIPIPSQI